VASFLGAANLVEARVLSVANGGGTDLFSFELQTDWGASFTAFGRIEPVAGKRVTTAVRPEGIRLMAQVREPGAGLWTGVIESVQFLGDAVDYRVRVRDHLLRTRCDRSQHFQVGDAVVIELRSKACTVLVD
jgi:iron(III) transport system ATP-binding protein